MPCVLWYKTNTYSVPYSSRSIVFLITKGYVNINMNWENKQQFDQTINLRTEYRRPVLQEETIRSNVRRKLLFYLRIITTFWMRNKNLCCSYKVLSGNTRYYVILRLNRIVTSVVHHQHRLLGRISCLHLFCCSLLHFSTDFRQMSLERHTK